MQSFDQRKPRRSGISPIRSIVLNMDVVNERSIYAWDELT